MPITRKLPTTSVLSRSCWPLRHQHHDDLHACAEVGSRSHVKPVGFVNQPVCLNGCNRRNSVGSQHIWQAIANVCFWTSNLNLCSSAWLSTCVLQFVLLIVCCRPQAVERPVFLRFSKHVVQFHKPQTPVSARSRFTTSLKCWDFSCIKGPSALITRSVISRAWAARCVVFLFNSQLLTAKRRLAASADNGGFAAVFGSRYL